MLGRTPFLKPPDALVDQAQSVLESAGYESPPADVFWAFALDSDYLRYLKNGGAPARTDPYGAGRPPFTTSITAPVPTYSIRSEL
jgi:hypothetical protein